MTDLPQRLRAASPEGMLSGHVNDLPALREAADEIERLRAALVEARNVGILSGDARHTDKRIREICDSVGV